jgi:hypothetical protein
MHAFATPVNQAKAASPSSLVGVQTAWVDLSKCHNAFMSPRQNKPRK